MDIIIKTDIELLDINFIHQFISNSYWGRGRTKEETETCIKSSLNFGVYVNSKQIGYARVLTDYVTLVYIMDVFLDESYRGKGYAKELMNFILNYKEIKNVKSWRLATKDAHGLYKNFGFKAISQPQNMMERVIA